MTAGYVEPKAIEDGPRVLLSVDAAARALSIGRSSLYQLMASGEVASVRIGARRLVPRHALDVFVAECQNAQPIDSGRALAEDADGAANSKS